MEEYSVEIKFLDDKEHGVNMRRNFMTKEQLFVLLVAMGADLEVFKEHGVDGETLNDKKNILIIWRNIT